MSGKGSRSKEKVIEEAFKLFQQKGFGATSINDLMAASGLKKGTLYFHFSDKEEIGMLVLQRARTELMDFLDKTLTGTTPAACLLNYFDRTLEWHRRLEFVGGCIFGNAALEMADSNDLYARFISQVFAEWGEKIRMVIAAAQGAGQIRTDLTADALAHHVVTATEGAIMLSRLRKDDQQLISCFDSLRTLLILKDL